MAADDRDRDCEGVGVRRGEASPGRYHIRWMIRLDMPDLLWMDLASFGPHAWDEEAYLKMLRRRDVIAMVAEEGGDLRGAMVYRLKPAEIRLVRLVVHPEHRRRGVGRAMVHKLIGKLSPHRRTAPIGELSLHRRTAITLDVRASNLDAQLWLRSLGFLCVAIRDGRYRDTGEDGYRFVYRAPWALDE